jgi:SAM-dependent methyltransferase
MGKLLDLIQTYFPYVVKSRLRGIVFYIVDMVEGMLGLTDGLTPPRKAKFETGGKFVSIGKEFLQYFHEMGGLTPNECVLDVGCGVGRMAVPLTTYLSSDGEYWGFDIVNDWIEWCSSKISPCYPNFHFHWANLYNGKYNPKGKSKASEFVFPYEGDRFHFVFATSVLTHMFPPDVGNYLSEIARVLKPGGRCLLTFFLLNNESKMLMDAGSSTLIFAHEVGSCYTVDRSEPEIALAFEESMVRDLHESNGLMISEPILFGSWSGRDHFLSYQDIVLAQKGS